MFGFKKIFYPITNNSLLLLLIIIVLSCDKQSRIERTLYEMECNPILIPIEDLVCCPYDSTCDSIDTYKYKMVIYADSSRCSSCFIKHLSKWNEYLDLEKKGKVEVIFILETKKAELEHYCYETRFSRINHPVYFDTEGFFRNKNPHIPANELFHVFLIDQNDRIILVGNPVTNPKIRNMFIETLNKVQTQTKQL